MSWAGYAIGPEAAARCDSLATSGLNLGGSNPYDTAGNMTSWNGANGYSYGPFNETWRVVTSNQEWVHVYTADDERLFSYEVGGGQLRRWALRGLDNRVLREYTFVQEAPSGVIERDNIYRGSGPLLAAATPAGDRHYHVDHLGTPRQITDATGAQVAFHTYYPYGEEATSPTQDTVRFKFTGHERDLADPTSTQDDLDHMHARMTNPKLGRFLSVDPEDGVGRIQSPQSFNRYTYAMGGPLRLVDPNGRWALPWEVLDAYSYDESRKAWAQAAEAFAANPGVATGVDAAAKLLLNAYDSLALMTPALPGFAGLVDNLVTKADDISRETLAIGKWPNDVPGSLKPGERMLDLPKQPNPRLNWKQNAGKLREAMSSGNPIRDAAVDANGALRDHTGFLKAERELLRSKGWKYRQEDGLWFPPDGWVRQQPRG